MWREIILDTRSTEQECRIAWAQADTRTWVWSIIIAEVSKAKKILFTVSLSHPCMSWQVVRVTPMALHKRNQNERGCGWLTLMSRLEGQTQEGPFLGGGVDEGVPLLAQSKTSDLSAAVYKCLHNTTTAPEKYRTNVLTRRPQNT